MIIFTEKNIIYYTLAIWAIVVAKCDKSRRIGFQMDSCMFGVLGAGSVCDSDV